MKLTENQKKYIKEWYGKCKAQDIATQLSLPLWRVYEAGKEIGVNKTLNPDFDISDVQEQIILGGIIGDGSFKKNGSNYYYRECHAVGEKDYLLWKFKQLYNLTTQRVYDIPSRYGHSPQLGFQTVNSPTFLRYVCLTKHEVITKLSELGYLIWILDDGWVASKERNSVHISVASGTLTDEELNAIINKGIELGLNGHVVGKKQKEVSFLKPNNKRIKEISLQFLHPFMDIMRKKILCLKC